MPTIRKTMKTTTTKNYIYIYDSDSKYGAVCWYVWSRNDCVQASTWCTRRACVLIHFSYHAGCHVVHTHLQGIISSSVVAIDLVRSYVTLSAIRWTIHGRGSWWRRKVSLMGVGGRGFLDWGGGALRKHGKY